MTEAEPGNVSNGAGDNFDRAAVHAWSAEAVRYLTQLLAESRAAREAAERSVRDAQAAVARDALQRRLQQTTVEDLAARGSKIQTKALRAGNVLTAADVIGLGRDRLLALSGVGDVTVDQLLEFVEQLRRPQVADGRPSSDPSRWTSVERGLAGALQLLAVIAPALGLPNVAAVGQVLELVRAVRRATRRLAWLTSSKRRKSDTARSYSTARSAYTSARAAAAYESLTHGLSLYYESERVRPSPAEVESRWRQNSASLYALLEEVVSGDIGVGARAPLPGTTFIPSDLIERIEHFQLDRTLIRRTLRNYQVFGAKYAVVVGRALLGDDMGLGKTVQALAAIGHLTHADRQRHHVVVCPAQLVDNWLREANETLADVGTYAYRQPGRDATFAEWTQRGGLLVTSYEQAANLDPEALPPIGMLVADEAHYAKNPSALRAISTAKLARRSARCLLMSGTLLENRAEEMIRLAGLADPDAGASITMRFGDGSDALFRADEFRKAFASIYLRRNQSEVLTELPEIVATDESIAVGPTERAAYEAALRDDNLMKARAVLTCGAGAESAKMTRLSEIAEECRAADRKMLVFSFFRDVVALAADVIGPECTTYDGSTSRVDGERRLEAFRSEPGFAALSLQIDKGGTGLNLQAASVVVLMEPQFKPSTEWQAMKRAHRMGQTSTVVVHRLVAQDSVDVSIVRLTEFKAELFNELARQSDLADSSLSALDRNITESNLLASEKSRLTPSPAPVPGTAPVERWLPPTPGSAVRLAQDPTAPN